MNEQSPPEDEFEINFDIRIPKSRIAVLIGADGETKGRIEQTAQCKLDIDSQEGDVNILGNDAVLCFVAKDMVRAIGRGFNPDYALELSKIDHTLEIIDISDGFKSKNSMQRIKARVIGSKGKTRSVIEKTMQVHMSIFGKTIGIIGNVERVMAAKQAIDMILDGSPHSNVYRWLEKKEKGFAHMELQGNNIEVKDEFKKYLE